MKELENYSARKQTVRLLPSEPGVYIFKDNSGNPIYIGKARNLKNRVGSYFAGQLDPKTSKMVRDAIKLSFIVVLNELEAILLEAKLVRQFMPKFNIQLKDDKSPIYIVVTKDQYPRILTTRKTDLANQNAKYVFGPFLSAIIVRRVLRDLRKVFPYSTHKLGKRPCIYSQIGLCKPCPNLVVALADVHRKMHYRKVYMANIQGLVRLLQGKISFVRRQLEKQMADYAKGQEYEKAQEIKRKIRVLEYISRPVGDTNPYIENPNLIEDIRQKELENLKEKLSGFLEIKKLSRIECFDVAHLASSFPTASMVTFTDGEPDKRHYRHFKIYSKLKGDTDRMKEVLERRKKHFSDWGVPDLVIVDGGKPQVSAAVEILGNGTKIVGLAKKFETLVVKTPDGFSEIKLKREPALYLVQRLRDEAHRFARRLHHKQVARVFDRDA